MKTCDYPCTWRAAENKFHSVKRQTEAHQLQVDRGVVAESLKVPEICLTTQDLLPPFPELGRFRGGGGRRTNESCGWPVNGKTLVDPSPDQ